jgi:hypothetical protein
MARLSARARALATLLGVGLAIGPVLGSGGSARAAVPTAATARIDCSQVPADESDLIQGRLTACGTSLIDAIGHRVRLRTYRFNGFLPGNGELAPKCGHWHAPPSSMAQELRPQGFNSVFMMLSWANLEPTRPTKSPNGTVVHHWDTGYLQAVDTAIDQFAAQGIGVVLGLAQWKWSPAFTDLDLGDHVIPCGEGMPKWLYPNGGGIREMAKAEHRFYKSDARARSGYLKAWSLIAKRYANTRAVVGFVLFWEAYDLIAQPYLGHTLTPADLRIARWYETIGRVIRKFQPSQLLIAPDWWPPSESFFALLRRPRLANLVYTFEYYQSKWNDSARSRLAGYIRRARRWNIPAWNSEFNAFGHATAPGTPEDPDWARDTNLFLERAKSVRLGWAIFGTVDSDLATILRRWGP